jgi:hypothetical protein
MIVIAGETCICIFCTFRTYERYVVVAPIILRAFLRSGPRRLYCGCSLDNRKLFLPSTGTLANACLFTLWPLCLALDWQQRRVESTDVIYQGLYPSKEEYGS